MRRAVALGVAVWVLGVGPTSAGNAFQALTQDLTITYTATQLAGTAR